MDRGPCVQYSSRNPVDHIDALHGWPTFVLLVAAVLADGVLDHYETETNARMRHEPNASLHLCAFTPSALKPEGYQNEQGEIMGQRYKDADALSTESTCTTLGIYRWSSDMWLALALAEVP